MYTLVFTKYMLGFTYLGLSLAFNLYTDAGSRTNIYTTMPNIVAVPELGGDNPQSMLIRVVFPAPLWPSKAVIWPSYISSDNSKIKLRIYFYKKNLTAKCDITE